MAEIELRMFASLRQYQPEGGRVEIAEGDTIQKIIERFRLPDDEVNIIFVNGVSAKRDRILKDGDRVGLFPAVGGG